MQSGVYEAVWGIHRVRVLVLSEMPEAPQNAVWGVFSNVAARVVAAAQQYRPHTDDVSTIMNELLNRYKAQGVVMPYTVEDFRRDYAREHLHQLTPEERTEGLSPEERTEGLSPEELLRGRSVDEVLRGLRPEERLRGLPLEERLRGLPAEEIQAYLRQLEYRTDRKSS